MLSPASHYKDLHEMGNYRNVWCSETARRDAHFNRIMLSSEERLQRLKTEVGNF